MESHRRTRKPRSKNTNEVLDEETERYQKELGKLRKPNLFSHACAESIKCDQEWTMSDIQAPLVAKFQQSQTRTRWEMERRLVARIGQSKIAKATKKSRESQTLGTSDSSKPKVEMIERIVEDSLEKAVKDIISKVAKIVWA